MCRDIWSLWDLRFVPDQTPEIMSVGQVLAKGYASCTGLSIFLVNACRAVGIPARLAGTPSWVQDRRDSPEERFNNHNWVEVWDGTWSFTGVREWGTRASCSPSDVYRCWPYRCVSCGAGSCGFGCRGTRLPELDAQECGGQAELGVQ